MAGDLTLVMDGPAVLGIRLEELIACEPRHPQLFHRPPVYRCGGPRFARLPGDIPAPMAEHSDTSRPKLYRAMGVSGPPRVLRHVIDVVNGLGMQSLIVTTTIPRSMTATGPSASCWRRTPLGT